MISWAGAFERCNQGMQVNKTLFLIDYQKRTTSPQIALRMRRPILGNAVRRSVKILLVAVQHLIDKPDQ